MNSKIYILLSTCNRAHLIEESLKSIQAQTYKNWECIIVDDHSTDSTGKVVEQFLKQDSRFFYFGKSKEYSRGLSGSRNQGMDIARRKGAEFIQFFDDDDIMHPHKLEVQIEKLLSNSEYDFSIAGTKNFWKKEELKVEQQQELQIKNFSLGEAYLTGQIKFVAQSFLFRLRFFKGERFNENLFYAEEWELFCKLFFRSNPRYDLIQRVLFYRRKHSGAVTEKKESEGLRLQMTMQAELNIFDYLTKNNLHTVVTLNHFGRKFLLYRYDSKLLRRVGEEIKKKENMSYMKFKAAQSIHWLTKKIILRIFRY